MMTTIQRMDWLKRYGMLHVKPKNDHRDHAWVQYVIEHEKLSWQCTGIDDDEAIEKVFDMVKDMLYNLCKTRSL